jgi:outer membrane immunogenic protein
MKNFAFIAALLGSTALAQAADLPMGSMKDAPVASGFEEDYTWRGFYLGLGAGFGVGSNVNTLSAHAVKRDGGEAEALYSGNGNALALPAIEDELSGPIYGLQAGYNWQVGRIVFGVEGEFNGADINGQENFGLLGIANVQTQTEVSWLAALEGSLGFTGNGGRTRFYAHGGVAWADVEASSRASIIGLPGSIETSRNDETHFGFVYGVGVEHKIDTNWSAFVKYSHYDFDSETSSTALKFDGRETGIAIDHKTDLDLDTIKVGVNYKFY